MKKLKTIVKNENFEVIYSTMKKLLNKFIVFSILILGFGCSAINNIPGIGFDSERFDLARKSKIIKIRLEAAQKLKERLYTGTAIDDADINFLLREEFLNKIANQYESSSGWLDESTMYKINKIDLKFQNGSALASITLLAHNTTHNIDIKLMLDCLITIEQEQNHLVLRLEPFNIMPVLTTRGFYFAVKSVISDIIKINLGRIGENLPAIKIPVNLENHIKINGSKTDINSKLKLSIINHRRIINYKLRIKEILFFDGNAFLALNLKKIEVK